MILTKNEMKTHLFLKTFNSARHLLTQLLHFCTESRTALLKINTKLHFHSVYGYYRLYESQYKLYRQFRLHILYKLYRLCGLDRLYRINKLMILIKNEMKTHLFLKTFNVASTYLYRITTPPNSKLILILINYQCKYLRNSNCY